MAKNVIESTTAISFEEVQKSYGRAKERIMVLPEGNNSPDA
jgi:hypothetical protein